MLLPLLFLLLSLVLLITFRLFLFLLLVFVLIHLHLLFSRTFLVGERLTLADVAVACTLLSLYKQVGLAAKWICF